MTDSQLVLCSLWLKDLVRDYPAAEFANGVAGRRCTFRALPLPPILLNSIQLSPSRDDVGERDAVEVLALHAFRFR